MSLPGPLVDWIEAEGQVPFDRYMTFVLYEPGFGYYQTHVPGDDYRTSPVISPWFGRLIAKELERRWNEMLRPDEFDVIEIGAGRGDLAADALSAIGPPFADAIRWTFVEPFPLIASRQRETVGERGRWVNKLEEIEPTTGCILANEVLDNFPVKVFEVGEDGVLEVFVTVKDDLLIEELRPTDVLAPDGLEPGGRFEHSPHLIEWVSRASRVIESGSVLLIDYGDTEPDIYLRRPSGTLLTYGPDGLGTDPFVSPGELDITAHVNMTSLSEAFGAEGFTTSVTTQREFLKGLGIDDIAATLLRRQSDAGRDPSALTIMSERSKLTALISKSGLGDLRVLSAERVAGS